MGQCDPFREAGGPRGVDQGCDIFFLPGVKPAGDDILDEETVADPFFGCQFTEGSTGATPDILRTGICANAM